MSPVDSAVFWIALFEALLSASVADCLAWSRTYVFAFISTQISRKRKKSIAFYKYLGWTKWHALFYKSYFNQ